MKNNKVKLVAIIVVLVALIVGAIFLYNSLKDKVSTENMVSENYNENEVEEEHSKQVAPDFTFTDVNGNKVNLSDFVGKPVVLNFWASWCGPCKMEMPHFEEKYQEYKDEINFIMLNLTDGDRETVEGAQKFIDKNGYNFPVYFDTENSQGAFAYSVYAVPTTFFIDKDGNLVVYAQSAIDSETLQKGIDMIK